MGFCAIAFGDAGIDGSPWRGPFIVKKRLKGLGELAFMQQLFRQMTRPSAGQPNSMAMMAFALVEVVMIVVGIVMANQEQLGGRGLVGQCGHPKEPHQQQSL